MVKGIHPLGDSVGFRPNANLSDEGVIAIFKVGVLQRGGFFKVEEKTWIGFVINGATQSSK